MSGSKEVEFHRIVLYAFFKASDALVLGLVVGVVGGRFSSRSGLRQYHPHNRAATCRWRFCFFMIRVEYGGLCKPLRQKV